MRTTKKRTTRETASRRAKPSAAGAPKPKLVGFYADPSLVADAQESLGLDALTLSEFLLDRLTERAQEVRAARRSKTKLAPRRVNEGELAKRLGKSRKTIAKWRERGIFGEGAGVTFEIRPNGRVVYYLARALSHASLKPEVSR